MNIHHLRSVAVLAEKLNFTRAAEELHIVQPALSRQIKQIEEVLGVSLFKRNKRNVELTAAGQYFVQESEKLVAQFDLIAQRTGQIGRGEAGEVRIGFTHSMMQTILPNMLKAINKQLPGLKSILREMNNHDQYYALQHGQLELGFATNPLVPTELKSKVLHVDTFVVLLPHDHSICEKTYQDFSVFEQEEFIFPSLTDGPNYVNIVESICLDAGFKPKVVHETDSASTSFRLVEAGIGISIEPASSLHGMEIPVKSIELKDIRQKAELTMMWSADTEQAYPKLFELLKNW